jgi:C-terminal processing protease CtpA/Prc
MDMRAFADTAVASEALANAMRFLSGTDALIIDLRNNRGGEPEMLALLASYFFEGRTLLTTLTSDDPSRVQQNWTVPVRGPRYLDRPVYVVTSSRVTFSAAEGFSYVMQALGKAKVVGEKTGGGSNPSDGYILNRNFAIMIPYATPVVPATGSNWAAGVVPDIAANADAAVRTAQIAALETLLQGKPDDLSGERRGALADLKRQAEAPPAP